MNDTEDVPSRRETIEAAFEAVNEPAEAPTPAPAPVEAPPAPTEAPPTETQQAKAERARDPKGRFAARLAEIAAEKAAARTAAAPTPAPAKSPPTVAKLQPKGDAAPSGTPKPEAQPGPLKPPSNWKPAAREKWASLPPEVQAESVRTDREAKAALEQSAQARRGWDAFTKTVEPYRAMIQADGADPIQAVGSLFQTAAVLRTGSPHQKAQLAAEMCRSYGIDVGLLDAALVGHGGQPQTGHAQPAQYRDPRVDQLIARAQHAEQQRAQSLNQKAQSDIDAFASQAEFFDDVRQDMADLLEVAAKRGVTLSVEDAYNRATQLHPEVSKVLAQRREAEAATAQSATMQRRQTAGVSVRTRPAGPTTAPAPQGLRASLEAAWDNVNR